jgi:hypothetical protein
MRRRCQGKEGTSGAAVTPGDSDVSCSTEVLEGRNGHPGDSLGPTRDVRPRRRRIRLAAQDAAHPSGRYRPGRNSRPASASSRVAGCRTAALTKARAFDGSRSSRSNERRSVLARRARSRSAPERRPRMSAPRVSWSVARRRSLASLFTNPIVSQRPKGETSAIPWLRYSTTTNVAYRDDSVSDRRADEPPGVRRRDSTVRCPSAWPPGSAFRACRAALLTFPPRAARWSR